MNNIAGFHISNNYYVKIKPIPNMLGCIAIFPKNLFTLQPEITRTYIINENPTSVEIYNTENNKTTMTEITVEKHEVRLVILKDILFTTIERGISTKLIVIEGSKSSNIFSVLTMDMTKEELELERNLCIEFRKNVIENKY